MFKRFFAVYGDDFRLLSGKTAYIIPKEQETKPSRKQEKQRQNDRPREKRSEGLEIITDPIQTQHLINKLINSAREKIEILFSSINLFYYYNHHKKTEEGFQLLERVAAKKGLDVKIITPDKNIKEISSKINNKKLPDIQIRYIEETCFLGNKIMLLLVDGKQSLALQLREKDEEYAEGAPTAGYNVMNKHQVSSE
jgi:phosphatidylserine/phosphatidylglycerophosphate/cardiolipin synthase-like enzyme